MPVKSERAWSAHLHTTQHNLRLSRERDAAQVRTKEVAPAGKKRKAVEFEEPLEVERKKVKPTTQSSDHDSVVEAEDTTEATVQEQLVVEVAAPSVLQDELDDAAAAAELEALQRDLAALEQENLQHGGSSLAALSAPATIAAPAMTAQELAAQAREEQSKQRTRRDEEIEDEREDAARALEDEFEEMDSLQERLKKLRERREALRHQTEVGTETAVLTSAKHAQEALDQTAIEDGDRQLGNDDSQDSDEDSDEDDAWAFGAR